VAGVAARRKKGVDSLAPSGYKTPPSLPRRRRTLAIEQLPSSPLPNAGPEPALRLRPWQREALAAFEAKADADFLAVATPGAGKTNFALAAVWRALTTRKARRVVVVVPTQHLKTQWAQAAERFDIHLDPDWSAGYGALPSDVHGVAVTYQQVAANPAALRPMVRGALVILDEIHHAGESRSWGDGVRTAFQPAVRRLCLSGTPFRSDQSIIPFVRYEGDEAQSDYEYSYGQALKDRAVVRPVYFPRINGRMEWTAPDGQEYDATFDDALTRELANQRLRTALNGEGEWLPAVLEQAHAQLMHLRVQDPSAGGLVIAMDQDHARAISRILYDRMGVSAAVATSDDPAASKRISDFVESQVPWIVAVRMVSEGVDIPRLRVGVYATNTVTDLFFRQAVGRLVRWTGRLARQAAYVFIPDDARLRKFAATIAEQRKHSLRKKDDSDFPEGERQERQAKAEPDPGEQLSLFAAISAVPESGGVSLEDVRRHEEQAGDAIPDLVEPGQAPAAEPFFLTSPDGPAAVPLPDPEPLPPVEPTSPLARRRSLREANGELARELAQLTHRTHAQINSELNRKVGIKRVSEASVRQLEQRLEAAKLWLRKR
jgi:superfamily II DNA or RNA helicase